MELINRSLGLHLCILGQKTQTSVCDIRLKKFKYFCKKIKISLPCYIFWYRGPNPCRRRTTISPILYCLSGLNLHGPQSQQSVVPCVNSVRSPGPAKKQLVSQGVIYCLVFSKQPWGDRQAVKKCEMVVHNSTDQCSSVHCRAVEYSQVEYSTVCKL